MASSPNKTPLAKNRGEKRELRDSESKAVIAIPLVVRIIIVGVQPGTIVIAINVKQVRIAIRIVRNITQTTTH